MKIFGIGTDIVNIKRMQKTLKINDNFKKKINNLWQRQLEKL